MTAPEPNPTPGTGPVHAREPRPAGLVIGILLVVLGTVFLVVRVADIRWSGVTWPLGIIVPGLALVVASFLVGGRGGLGLAIPGTMIAIVGAILWVQETYGLYSTWAYAWALVAPTGPGIAMLGYGLFIRDRAMAADGLRTAMVGIGLFIGFAVFFEGALGLSGDRVAGLDTILPVVIVAFGALLVALSLFGGSRRAAR